MTAKQKKNHVAPTPPAADDKVMKRQALILLAFFAIAGLLWMGWNLGEDHGWGNPDRAIKRKMDLAQRALVERRLDATIDLYKQILTRYPSHPSASQAEMGLASAYEDSGHLDEALGTYQHLLEHLRSSPGTSGGKSDLIAFTLLQIAKLDNQKGQQDQALAGFTQVRTDYPGTDWAGEAMAGIGKAYQGQRHFDQAVKAYQAVIKEFPKGFLAAEAQSSIGECYEAQNKPDQALKAYRTVLEKYPAAVWDEAKQKIEELSNRLKAAGPAEKIRGGGRHGSEEAG
jgi:TolA-binding protein